MTAPLAKPCVRRITTLLGLVALLLCLQSHATRAQSLWYEERLRLDVGVKLFPACLSAVTGLKQAAGPDGRLLLLAVHDGEPDQAREVVGRLRLTERIGGLPIRVEPVSAERIDDFQGRRVGGIFVTSPGLEAALFDRWAQEFSALVFSPFTGDVERGSIAGIYVTERIVPYINTAQVRRAGLHIRPFFMRVARHYD